MADVDDLEEAEIRRLEHGAADDDAGGLLTEAAALVDGTRGVVRKSARREGQDPDNLVDVCTVGIGSYLGMELNVYEYPATNLTESNNFKFYMTKDARKKFLLLEHYNAPRTQHGLPHDCKIRLKEEMLVAGTLICAIPACRRPPSVGHGTLHYVIDSTTEEEPSKTALKRHNYPAKKIAEGKAQILCKECELKKTCQASPGAQGSSRPRVEPI
jgi:hypothetical protein